MKKFKRVGTSVRFIDGNSETGTYRIVDKNWLNEQIYKHPTRKLYSDALSFLLGEMDDD
jgi:hypothetical protein